MFKTANSPRPAKRGIRQLLLIVPMIIGCSFAAKAGPILDITIDSTTTLTYTYSNDRDGSGQLLQTPINLSGTVTASPANDWSFSIGGNVFFSQNNQISAEVAWEDPNFATTKLYTDVLFQQSSGNGTLITITGNLSSVNTGTIETPGQVFAFPQQGPPEQGTAQVSFRAPPPSALPDGGWTVGLLGAGLVALGVVRRKLGWS